MPPLLMDAPPLDASEVRNRIQRMCIARAAEARAPRVVTLWDKNWERSWIVFGESKGSFKHKLNDSAEGRIEFISTPFLEDWLFNNPGESEDLHITVQTGSLRWSGKCTTIDWDDRDNGFRYLTASFISEYEHVKKTRIYKNPFLPAEVQWPKIFGIAGPSRTCILTTLFLNIMRRFALPWTISDNLFDPAAWVENINPAHWPMIVKPIGPFTDTSMWCVMASAFGSAHDMFAATLRDAGLRMTVERWLPGDPQPAEDWYTLEKPTLVIGVDDVSGYRGLTGTVLDGLAYLVLQVADDLINEVVTEIDGVSRPAEYMQPGYKGTLKNFPWVTFRSLDRTFGISSVQQRTTTIHKATASSIVTGGKSPQWVNSGIKLLLNASLGYLGQLIGNPNIFVDLVYPQLEDVFLAYDRMPNPFRVERMGKHGPPLGEDWSASGGTGFSLSALQAIRTGFWKSRAYTTTKVVARNADPYIIGAHCTVGDRVAVEVGNTGWYYCDMITEVMDEWDRSTDPLMPMTIGDGQLEDEPGAILSRQIANVKAIVQATIGAGS